MTPRMSTRRGARALLAIALSVACIGLAPTAGAQQENVRILLVGQTPWTTPARPKLSITISATNEGTTSLTDLSVGLTIGQPIRARLTYESSLISGPGPEPIYGQVLTPENGTLEPGSSREFSIRLDVSDVAGISQLESLVYPLGIQLLSQGTAVASLNTAEIHYVRAKESPLLVGWWAEVSAPVVFNPQGQVADPSFETSIAPGGELRAEADALAAETTASPDVPVHMAVEPALLDELVRMALGYDRAYGPVVPRGTGGSADAEAVLVDLRRAAAGSSARVSAMPFSAPLLPSLAAQGLSGELDRQRELGNSTVFSALGVIPDSTVIRPPGGALDEASVLSLSARGVTTILADPSTVPRPPQPNDFAPPPTAVLPAGPLGMNVVLPDPSVESLLSNPALLADPVLAAQATLGEIATIWREDPVPAPPTARGIAIGLPAALPGGIWSPLLERIGAAPFLTLVRPKTLVASVNPPGAETTLASPSSASFSRSYVTALRTERANVTAYRSMLAAPNPLSDQLDRDLLFAQAGQYVGDELAGRAWYDHVHTTLTAIFDRASPDPRQVFTFTSSSGTILLQMGDPGPTPLRMTVVLRSSKFTFPDGDQRFLILARPHQIVTFRAEATSSGPGAIQVFVRAPSGLYVSQEPVIVRSTAVSRIAIIITAAAALLLAALWSRRLFRRRTT
jgi:hypothetical protein